MTIYTCERCHYETHLRSDFKRHLEKRIPCPPTHSDIDTKTLLEHLQQPKKYCCEHCDKSFLHARNRWRHIKAEHPNIVSTNQSHNTSSTETHNHSHNATTTNETNTNCHNTSQSHNTEHSHNTTHNTTNNNNVNIHLNVFGKEELSHIIENEEFLTHCVKHITGQGLQKIINSIWCNRDVPENHNVELKRERKPRIVNVFVQDDKGKRWVEKLADDIVDDMIRKGTGILQVHNNKLYQYDEELGSIDIELHDIRTEALTKIANKSRGYSKKRDAIVVELKNHKATKK
jgi:hypothetical protein